MTKGPRLGRGRTAEVFVWGDDRALKLFFDWAPAAWVEAEAARTRARAPRTRPDWLPPP